MPPSFKKTSKKVKGKDNGGCVPRDFFIENEERLTDLQRIGRLGSWELDILADKLTWSDGLARIFEINSKEFKGSHDSFLNLIHPDDRSQVSKTYQDSLKSRTPYRIDYRILMQDSRLKYIREECEIFYDNNDTAIRSVGIVQDITEQKNAEREHIANLKFMESMDKVNRAIQGTRNLEQMMSDVLDVVISVFDCDRAWLLYPSDPETAFFRVPMERTKPEYLRLPLGKELLVDGVLKRIFQAVRATSGRPVTFDIIAGLDSLPEIPQSTTEDLHVLLPLSSVGDFHIKSQIAIEIYPKIGSSYMFGIHQCSYRRVWTADEKRLFQEIGRRLADGLTSLLAYHNLQEKEKEYRRIVETANEGILVINKERKITFTNSRMTHILGYSEREILEHCIDDFIFPEEKESHNLEMKERQMGKASFYDRRFVRKDGETIWCSVSAVPLFDTHGQFDGSLGMLSNITERKIAEIELAQKNRTLRMLSDINSALIRITEEKKLFQEVGRIVIESGGYRFAWIGYYGKKDEAIRPIVFPGTLLNELQQKKIIKTIGNDSPALITLQTKKPFIVQDIARDPISVGWREDVLQSECRSMIALPLLHGDKIFGVLVVYASQVSVFTESEIATLKEMTSDLAFGLHSLQVALHEKEVTKQLQVAYAKEKALMENLGEAVMALDTHGVIISANRDMERLLRLPSSQLVGKVIEEVIPLKDDHDHLLLHQEFPPVRSIAIGAQVGPVEFRLVLNHKKEIPVEISSSLVRDDGIITGVVIIVRDITKMKEIERLRTDFLLLASHQLRTPLSGTKWLIETLKTSVVGTLAPAQVKYVDYLYGINERMIRLVSDMLTVLRLESSEPMIHKERVSIPKLFDDLMVTVGAVAKSKNITVVNKSLEHTIPEVISDKGFLNVILSVFISNALSYSPDGSDIIFDVDESMGDIMFSVQDFGIGVPEEEQSHILDRFYRASNAKKTHPEGTGLGLYIADMIAKKLGGSVSFVSKVNEGSKFMLHIPLDTA